MRNIIALAHISLDGFMADSKGDMSFVSFDQDLADHTYPTIDSVDLAVYGRVTYQMMEGYWPTAGDAPDAGGHAKRHARWYNAVNKLVASRTLKAAKSNVRVAGDDIYSVLRAEKQKPGGDIMIFGSPSLTRALAAADLVDEWRLTVQPLLVGSGQSLFGKLEKRAPLELRWSKQFSKGVIGCHYVTKR